jgi:hypothetical protein
MSVTKSYNKNNNTYYVYDTQYEWDEVQQKRVQIKRCIGKFDPVTGDIIPTGKRGKKSTAPPTRKLKLQRSRAAQTTAMKSTALLSSCVMFQTVMRVSEENWLKSLQK